MDCIPILSSGAVISIYSGCALQLPEESSQLRIKYPFSDSPLGAEMLPHEQWKILKKMLSEGKFEPYIRYIRFPYFKNLTPDTRIDFDFPITAIVGPNGTNKSSILRAIQGCPENNNLGNYWFSTPIDPILQTKEKPHCFIYGYVHNGVNCCVEVLKTRVQKPEDPDYWEPSRPLKSYDMAAFPAEGAKDNKNKTRWDTISKPTVYIDFRQSLSAFDKYFYQSEEHFVGPLRERKNKIRTRAPHLQWAIINRLVSYSYYGVERVIARENRLFGAQELEALRRILGRHYIEVQWIRHFFYNVDAYTCILRTKDRSYSEAFAGSGEFAVARLVADIMSAEPKSLILLDEPEVSLHPGAQERLVEFLTEQVIQNKHQVVISTHSPALIRKLPPEAIKAFIVDVSTGLVKLPSQQVAPEEAFFYLGEPLPNRITIVVEDILAEHMVRKALRIGGESFANRFQVRFFPGGSKTLWSEYLPIFAEEGRSDVLVLFDGDQRPAIPLSDPNLIPPAQDDALETSLTSVAGVKVKFSVDGGVQGGDAAQRSLRLRNFVTWVRKNVDYLPGNESPEHFIWSHMKQDELTKSVANIADPKKRFDALTRLELGRESYESVDSREIIHTQQTRLRSIPDSTNEIDALHNVLLSFANRNSH